MELKDILDNKPLVYASCLAFGVVIGVVTAEIVKHVNKDKVEKAKDEAIEKVEETLERHGAHIREMKDEYEELRKSVSYSNDDKVVGTDFHKPDLKEIIDYTKFSRKGEKVVAENGQPVDSDEPQEVDAPSVFEIITEAEFLKGTGNQDGYTSVVGTWYPEAKILTGWNEEEDEKDPRATIGEEALAKFDDPSVKAVYVRNTHLKVLFEIVRALGTFGEEE